MLLSDKHLRQLAESYELVTPFKPENCEGATIDLTLDKQVKKYNGQDSIVLGNKIPEGNYDTIDLTDTENVTLNPNESILVQAHEYFKIPTNMVGVIFEKYSFKLTGVTVSPASYMNPGYEGRLSFLMTNNSSVPVQLTPGIKFSQLGIMELSSESEKPYALQDARYMGSRDVHISQLHLDTEIVEYMQENNLGSISSIEARVLGQHLMKRLDENAERFADIIREKMGV